MPAPSWNASLQVVAITDLGLGSAEDAGAMAASGDAVAISLADGLIVDWSVVGVPRSDVHWSSACCQQSWPLRTRAG